MNMPLNKVRCYTVCFLLATVLAGGQAMSATYYVSPEGDDDNPGTREAPWRTAGHAGLQADAGDTVAFMPGDYTDALVPANSGAPGSPIEFRAEEYRTARLIGHGEGDWREGEGGRIRIHGVDHIVIRGFEVRDTADDRTQGGWLHVREASGVLITESAFLGGRRWSSFTVEKSSDIRVVDNDFLRATHSGDMFRIREADRVLVEGNSFTRDLHSMTNVNESERVVLRGNVLHSGWSRNGSVYRCSEVLLENNIFANAFNGSWSGGTVTRYVGDQIIFRFNQIFRAYGIPFRLDTVDFKSFSHYNGRNYHNVYHGNHGAGLVCYGNKRYFRGVVVKNNIFDRNDPHGSNTQLMVTGGGPAAIRVINNGFYGGADEIDTLLMHERKNALSLAEAERLPVFTHNFEMDPEFTNPAGYDFSLRESSPMRDAARPLTVARESGDGRELPVEDAYYFYDGYGITGERGDLIAVGESGNQARVVNADRERRVLHLDRGLEWDAGDPVAFPWSGTAPDLGVFEHGDSGRPGVQIVADRVRVEPGEAVRFTAVTRGLEKPLEYVWQLGDGRLGHGESVVHRYEEPRDYGVRVRVTDARGDQWVGVGYVSAEPLQDEDVLIHTTFDADDTEWWTRWQFYRGRRGTGYASYEHILDEETGKGYHHISTRDGTGPLPAFLHPRNWDIDKYPRVFIRYRIRPGTPVAIFVRPFPSIAHPVDNFDMREDSRRYYFAGTGNVLDGSGEGSGPLPEGPFPQTLHDDGEWHEILFDVRDIREQFPDVQVLQAINIGDLEVDGGAKVGPRDEFWLDEVYIGK